MSEARTKFPRSVAEEVFRELWHLLDPQPRIIFDGEKVEHHPGAICERLCAVGGFRRRKTEMKDLELLYIPKVAMETDPADLFGAQRAVDVTERLWEQLLGDEVFAKRMKENGAVSAWGAENKHALHVPSGLPIDLFAATAENWHNRLVVTTGSVECNKRIAVAAREMGWEWEVYDAGFVPIGGTWAKCERTRRTMRSEREVFAFVGMPFLEPEERK